MGERAGAAGCQRNESEALKTALWLGGSWRLVQFSLKPQHSSTVRDFSTFRVFLLLFDFSVCLLLLGFLDFSELFGCFRLFWWLVTSRVLVFLRAFSELFDFSGFSTFPLFEFLGTFRNSSGLFEFSTFRFFLDFSELFGFFPLFVFFRYFLCFRIFRYFSTFRFLGDVSELFGMFFHLRLLCFSFLFDFSCFCLYF